MKAQVIKERNIFEDYKLETILMQKKFVTESIGDAWKTWSCYRPVIIKCQTGEGKTTFVEDVLVKDAIEKRRKILIVSNRISQSLANKKRLIEMYGIKNHWSGEELREQSFFGPYIVVMTYHKLFCSLNSLDSNDFEYVVFDEVHYFLNDATFSSTSGQLLNAIPYKFSNAKRIYISATPDEVIPYIVKAETNPSALARYRVSHLVKGVCCQSIYGDDSANRETAIREMIYACNAPMPILYESKENYRYLNINFFEDFEVLRTRIDSSKDKWIIFVTSKEVGKELHQHFKDSVYLDAETKEKNPKIFTEIVDKEYFESKVLICTSVFINGNNIKDEKVKNIIVFNTNISDIKQAIGRKRITDKKRETLNVFLHIPDVAKLKYRVRELSKTLSDYRMSQENPGEFSKSLRLDNEKMQKLSPVLYETKTGSYKFNHLTIKKVKIDLFYTQKILQMLEKDRIRYCRFIAKTFSLPFKHDMCELLIDGRKEIEKVLEECVDNSPFSTSEFEEISKKISRLRKKYGFVSKEDNFGVNRPTLGIKATNARLKEFEFKYSVEKTENLVCFKKI